MFQTRRVEPLSPSATEQTGAGSKTGRSSVRLDQVQSTKVADLWPTLQFHIRRALTRSAGDRMSEAEILRHLMAGSMHLTVAVRDGEIIGACLYQFTRRPLGMCCQGLIICGVDLEEWSSEMNKWLIARAKARGCYCAEAYCRDGLAEVLKSYGWRRKATVMEIKT